jgi:hypothetical protein
MDTILFEFLGICLLRGAEIGFVIRMLLALLFRGEVTWTGLFRSVVAGALIYTGIMLYGVSS